MVKIKRYPPASQDVFFQNTQFDEALGGTDPQAYWRGQTPDRRPDPVSKGVNRGKKARLKKAEEALEGHENKEAILKILRSE
jgi:hypothetical protein